MKRATQRARGAAVALVGIGVAVACVNIDGIADGPAGGDAGIDAPLLADGSGGDALAEAGDAAADASPDAALDGAADAADAADAGATLPCDGGCCITSLSQGFGANTTCAAVYNAGRNAVVCWGDDRAGQITGSPTKLGVKPTAYAAWPLSSTVKRLASNGLTCALDDAGRVTCWGGVGVVLPTTLDGTSYTAVTVGEYHACVVDAASTVYCWGYSADGDIGSTSESTTAVGPVLLDGGATLTGVRDVVAGATHTCAMTGDAVYCWGSNGCGQLGSGTYDNLPDGGTACPNGLPQLTGIAHPTATRVATLSDVSAVTATAASTFAMRGNGSVYAWGSTYEYALGNDMTSGFVTAPTTVPLDAGAAHVTAANHGCALIGDEAWCWGLADSGELGTSGTPPVVPTPARVPTSLRFRDITAGANHTCAVTSDGTSVYCWGSNFYGQLGQGTVDQGPSSRHPTPIVVPIACP